MGRVISAPRTPNPKSRIPSGMLPVRIPLRRGEIFAQLLRRSARTVAGRVALNPPPFSQRARIHSIEPKLIDQLRHCGLSALIVAGDHQRATIRGASWLAMRSQVRRIVMVERLDDLRGREVGLVEL